MNDHLEELKRALQTLALPAALQLSLFPEFVEVADEMAINFECALDHLGNQRQSLSDAQQFALDKLEREILAYSGPSWPQIWSGSDSLHHPVWTGFRQLAADTLATFGWEAGMPDRRGDLYVGEGDVWQEL